MKNAKFFVHRNGNVKEERVETALSHKWEEECLLRKL
jgi:hypothetical protein